MPRRAVTKEEGEMLMRLALAMAAEFKALIARVNNARRELSLPT